MTNSFKKLMCSTMIISTLLLTTQPCLAGSDDLDSVFNELVTTSNAKGITEVCKKNGIFRQNSGNRCKDTYITAFALAFCDNDKIDTSDPFKKTDCGKKAVKDFPASKEKTSRQKALELITSYTQGFPEKSPICRIALDRLQDIDGILVNIARSSCSDRASSDVQKQTSNPNNPLKQKLNNTITRSLILIKEIKKQNNKSTFSLAETLEELLNNLKKSLDTAETINITKKNMDNFDNFSKESSPSKVTADTLTKTNTSLKAILAELNLKAKT